MKRTVLWTTFSILVFAWSGSPQAASPSVKQKVEEAKGGNKPTKKVDTHGLAPLLEKLGRTYRSRSKSLPPAAHSSKMLEWARSEHPYQVMKGNDIEIHSHLKRGEPSWQPANMGEYLDLTMEQDSGGVHMNNGITNFAAYKIMNAMSRDGAEQILYRTLVNHLTKQSNFTDFRIAALSSAEELFGAQAVRLQWNTDPWGTLVYWFLANEIATGQWVSFNGPIGDGVWQYVVYGQDQFTNETVDFQLTTGGEYWLFVAGTAWDMTTRGDFTPAYVPR